MNDDMRNLLSETIGDDALVTMDEIAKDPQAFLNTPRVPKDAGEYADGLAAVLNRIPKGWGRWIDCGKGWYPLIIETDQRLAALDPDYEVHQVKEKFGGLRYYHQFVTEGSDHEAGWQVEREAENKSFTICESCGTTDDVETGGQGWITSRCAGCRDKPTQLGQF